MKKLPLWSVILITFLVFTSVLIAIYFILLRQGSVFEKDVYVESSFSESSKLVFVEDSDLGVYPGKKELNEGAKEFYLFLNEEDGIRRIQDEYKHFNVVKVLDNQKKEAVLYSLEYGEKTYTFNCFPERTFAYKNLNLDFISSGFDFVDTLEPSNTVLTKCYNEECSVLGPDCIIRVKVK